MAGPPSPRPLGRPGTEPREAIPVRRAGVPAQVTTSASALLRVGQAADSRRNRSPGAAAPRTGSTCGRTGGNATARRLRHFRFRSRRGRLLLDALRKARPCPGNASGACARRTSGGGHGDGGRQVGPGGLSASPAFPRPPVTLRAQPTRRPSPWGTRGGRRGRGPWGPECARRGRGNAPLGSGLLNTRLSINQGGERHEVNFRFLTVF